MNKRQSGFTLVELSVVLVIVGLLLSAAMSVGNTQIAQSRISITKTKEASIKTALIAFIAKNKRLPCPAVNVPPTDARYGLEAPNRGVCDGTASSGGVVTGLIPWVSLNLTSESAEDGYYNRFGYAVTATATNLDETTISGISGRITTHSSAPAAPGNQTNNCAAGASINPCAYIAMVISHGANALGAYTIDGTQITLPTGSDESENTNNDPTFVIKDYSNNLDNPYDDILLPLGVSDLITPLVINGSLRDSNASITRSFDAIHGAVVSIALRGRTGPEAGARSYTIPNTNVLGLGLPQIAYTDPWNNQIIYTPAYTLPVTSATTGSQLAYSIMSTGPDGAIGGGDDIVRNVYVSELQSLYINYGW